MTSSNKMKPEDFLTILFLLILTSAGVYYYMYIRQIEKFEGETTTTLPPPIPSSSAQTPIPSSSAQTPTPSSSAQTPTPSSSAQTPTPSSTGHSPTPSSSSEEQSSEDELPLCKMPIDPSTNKSVLSRFFGIGFNIEYVSQNDNDYYLIKHIPTLASGTLGGCYSITSDNLLTIKLKNKLDDFQLWSISESTDTTSTYYTIQPKSNSNYALQYENGNLALRPFNPDNVFEAQKWIFNTTEITRAIPVLNYSPGSLYTAEFDPYSSPDNNSNLSDTNSQQVNDVINAVKSGLKQYLGQLDNKNQKEQVSSSSLGQKESPLNVNLNLSSKSKQMSSFANVNSKGNSNANNKGTGKAKGLTNNDMLSIMDKYGVTAGNNSQYTPLYKTNNLENEINKIKGCKQINLKDYTSNRVGKCNCKL